MIKNKKSLTIDELIIIYLAEKIKLGYEIFTSLEEIIDFVTYFNHNKKYVRNSSFENNNSDYILDYCNQNNHLEVVDNVIKPTNEFGKNDVLDTQFSYMISDDKIRIRAIIQSYLQKFSKRQINIENKVVSQNSLACGNMYSILMINTIWNCYTQKYIDAKCWPVQCTDIEMYLFQNDLASIIGLPSIKSQIMSFYDTFSKRLAVLMEEENELLVSNSENLYVANSNYECLIKDYEGLMTYCSSKKFNISITFSKLYQIFPNIFTSEEKQMYITNDTIKNDDAKKLMKTIEMYRR